VNGVFGETRAVVVCYRGLDSCSKYVQYNG
jgi:hypothetical protein